VRGYRCLLLNEDLLGTLWGVLCGMGWDRARFADVKRGARSEEVGRMWCDSDCGSGWCGVG